LKPEIVEHCELNDNYFQFTQATNATVGGIQGGGFPVSAGPVTITP